MSHRFQRFAGVAKIGATRENEFSVVYLSEDWEELGQLLQAPQEFVRSREFLFRSSARHSIPWQLISPVNVHLICAWQDPSVLLSCIANLVNTGIIDPDEYKDKSGRHGEHASAHYVGDVFMQSLASHLQNLGLDCEKVVKKLKGMFVLEFAAYTSNVRVVYFPDVDSAEALHKKRMAKDRDGWKVRYQGSIVNPVLVEWGGRSESHARISNSVLHFDLSENSNRMRADYIMTRIEDPFWISDTLNKMAAEKKIAYKRAQLVLSGSDDGLQIETPREFKTDLKFAPGTPPIYMPERFAIYPRINASNLSVATVGTVCDAVPVTAFNGTLQLTYSFSEYYLCPFADPESMVVGVLAKLGLIPERGPLAVNPRNHPPVKTGSAPKGDPAPAKRAKAKR